MENVFYCLNNSPFILALVQIQWHYVTHIFAIEVSPFFEVSKILILLGESHLKSFQKFKLVLRPVRSAILDLCWYKTWNVKKR